MMVGEIWCIITLFRKTHIKSFYCLVILSLEENCNECMYCRSKRTKQKSRFAEEILRRLPEWFGNEKALIEYVNGVASLPFWAALNSDGKCIGFISIKVHYGNTGDIYVLGVLPEHHRKGIGKSLCCFTPLLKHPGHIAAGEVILLFKSGFRAK